MAKVLQIVREHIISQYIESETLLAFFEALATEGDVLGDAVESTNKFRTIEFAEGVNLDILGLLIGQTREVVDTKELVFFGFSPDPAALTFTDLNDTSLGGRYRSATEKEFTTRLLSDNEFRSVLLAGIQRNISKCTGDEIIDAVIFVLGLLGITGVPRVTLFDGNTYYLVFIGRILSEQERGFLSGISLMPKPAGVRVDYIEYDSANFFGFAADPLAKGFTTLQTVIVVRPQYETLIITDGPLLYLTLNDPIASSVAVNEVNVDGVMEGTYTFAVPTLLGTGEGSALDLSGVLGGINLTNAAPAVLNPYTLELWIKTDAALTTTSALMVDGGDGLHIANDVLMWRQGVDVLDTVTLLPGTVYHVVFSVDNTNVGTFYVNGVAGQTILSVQPVTIDKMGFTGIFDLPFDGIFDQSAIYDYALTPAQILEHYNIGKPISVIENAIISDNPVAYLRLAEGFGTVAKNEIDAANPGIYIGSLQQGVTGLIGNDSNRALYVNNDLPSGRGNGVDFTSPVLVSNVWSLECWLVLPDITLFQSLFYNAALTSRTSIFSGVPYYWDGNNGFFGNVQLQNDQRHYVVFTYDNGLGRVFLDAVDTTDPGSAPITNDLNDVKSICGYDVFGQLDGVIDEAAIYDYVLTQQQIDDHYNAGGIYVPPPVDPFLVVIEPLNLVSSVSVEVFGTEFEVDWGDGVFVPYINTVGFLTVSQIPTGNITIRNITLVTLVRFNSNNLRSIDIQDATSLTNFSQMCQGLTLLENFAAANTQNVIDFVQAWENCSSLLSMPFINTTGAMFLNGTWFNCSSLTSFPMLDVSNVIGFFSTWESCSGLTSFPLLDFTSADRLDSAWRRCSGLMEFPAIDFSTVTNFSSAWNECTQLLSMPAINTSAGTRFDNTWRGCTVLKCLSNVDTTNAVANTTMFNSTPALVAPDATEQSLIQAGGYVYVNADSCPSLGYIFTPTDWDLLSGGVTVDANAIYFSDNQGGQAEITTPQTPKPLADNVQTIVIRIPAGIPANDLFWSFANIQVWDAAGRLLLNDQNGPYSELGSGIHNIVVATPVGDGFSEITKLNFFQNFNSFPFDIIDIF